MNHKSNGIVGQPVFIVWMEDPIIHTDATPYCDDMTCLCHQDAQDVPPITDEEIAEVMAAPSPLERDIEEGYARIQRNVQRLMELL